MWAINRGGGGLPVRAAHLDHRDVRVGTVGGCPGSAAATVRPSSAMTRAGDRVSRAPMPVETASASASAAPRRRHGNAMTTCPNSGPVRPRTASRPCAHGLRDAPRQLHRDPRGRSQPLVAPGAPRLEPREAHLFRDLPDAVVAHTEPPPDLEHQLHGGTGEVEVGPSRTRTRRCERFRPRAYPAVGSATRSISAASARSFSVTPPASWVDSER